MHEWFYFLFVKSLLYTVCALMQRHLLQFQVKIELGQEKLIPLDFIWNWKPKLA